MVAPASSEASTPAGALPQGRSASRSAFEAREDIEVLPKNRRFRPSRSSPIRPLCRRSVQWLHSTSSRRGHPRFSSQTRIGCEDWARYYHPTLQRFLSEDPIAFAGGDLNVYAYVRNRPTRFVDPKGLQQLALTDPFLGPLNPNECIPRCTEFGDSINDPAMAAAVNRIFLNHFLEFFMGRIRALEPGMPPGCCFFGPAPAGAAPAVVLPTLPPTVVPPSLPPATVPPPPRSKSSS